MGTPVTRSRAQASASNQERERSPSPTSSSQPSRVLKFTDELRASLADLQDTDTVKGKHAEELRDVTAGAITEAWQDARYTTASLAKQINDNSASLLQELNSSFEAVGSRFQSLPSVVTCVPDGTFPKLSAFTGDGEQTVQFSLWLRRFEDVMRMKLTPLTSEQKAYLLVGHLDGVAREKVEELSADDKNNYDVLVRHLRAFFEGPQQRHIARQTLSGCQQGPTESCTAFASRLLRIVRAAMMGQDPESLKERLLEEYVGRLRSDIRYYVRIDNPATFEEAVSRAQTIEQSMAEAAAAKPIRQTTFLGQQVEAIAVPDDHRTMADHRPIQSAAPELPTNPSYRSTRARTQLPTSGRSRIRGTKTSQGRQSVRDITCFTCHGNGHFSRECPSRGRVDVPRQLVTSRRSSRVPNEAKVSLVTPDAGATPQVSVLPRDYQQELDNAYARISALENRNRELSKSLFGNDNQAASPAVNAYTGVTPSIHCLFLGLLCLLVPPSQAFESFPAWVCPTVASDSIIRIPFTYNCSRLLPDPNAVIEPLDISVFRPNTKHYSSEAYWCRILTSSATYSVNFFGARSLERTETIQTVSLEQCRLMRVHRRCEYGPLTQIESSWRTTNELSIDWPAAPFGCCTQHKSSVTNCLLFTTVVHASHSEDHPSSIVGDMSSCVYRTGFCTLKDGSALIWEPDSSEACRFIPLGKMKGHISGTIWLSQSKEFALSWTKDSERVLDCGKSLLITDQGYAISYPRRLRRSADLRVGMVTSNQLSAQLRAVEGSTQLALASMFQHALSMICQRVSFLGFSLYAALKTHPTKTARLLLGRPNIAASYLGHGLLQVHSCIRVPAGQWRPMAFNKTCYSRPFVSLSLPSGTLHEAFLETDTNVIVEDASEESCASRKEFFVSDGHQYFSINGITGQIAPVSPALFQTIPGLPPNSVFNASLPLTIFHNLVITNLSELVEARPTAELWSALEQHQVEEHIGFVQQQKATFSTPLSKGFGLFILGSWSLFHLWVLICSTLITLRTISTLIRIYRKINVAAGLIRWNTRHEPAIPPPMGTAVSSPPLVPSGDQMLVQPIPLQRLAIDASSAWPPKVRVAPLDVLTVARSSPFFIAQIPVHVNGIPLLALIDTGAAISVSSQRITPLLGVFQLSPPDIPTAIGMAGIPVPLVGKAFLNIALGNQVFSHQVYCTEGSGIPLQADKYNIILGNDILSRLPPWRIDYSAKKFNVGHDSVHIITGTPNNNDQIKSSELEEGIPVRVAETRVIPANSESFISCTLALPADSPIMFGAQESRTYEKDFFISPAVCHPTQVSLLVTNLASSPQILYARQLLGLAVPLYVEADETLVEAPHKASPDFPPTIAANDCASKDIAPLNIDLSRCEVNDAQRDQLRALFIEYRDRISHSSYDLGSYQHTLVDIKTTTDHPPMRFRPPRIPVKFQKELDDHINKLLKSGRIVESDTPWVHNTVLVRKRDGSLRVCLDFRPLNAITIPDHYPLPRIEDLLAKVAGHRYYTSLDLASGYMQLLMSPESQRKCGWATHRGIYQFAYLPFGLRNAGAYFCRAMSRILSGLEDNCLAYIDDIIIFDKTFEDHLRSLRKVFERFRLFDIKTSGKKLTDIARSKITFLGHEISQKSYSPGERNIIAIKQFPRPTTAKEVKRFIGMANFFRRFIKQFATIAAPLYELTREGAKFTWGSLQEESFDALRQRLISKPCLAYPRDADFILYTDGSNIAVGAGLFQEDPTENRKLVAIGYFSKTLSDSQRRWSPTDIELFAMISALRYFRSTIYGNLTRIFSDHKPLTFLLQHNKAHDTLARWIVELQSYHVTIQYVKGASNSVADCLSRLYNPESRFVDGSADAEDIVEFPRCLTIASPQGSLNPANASPVAIRPHDLLIEQRQDQMCNAIMQFLSSGVFDQSLEEDKKMDWLRIAEHCEVKRNGCLYYKRSPPSPPGIPRELIVVPKKLREPLFLAFHESPSAGGHFYWRKTLAKLSRKYFWPHMAEDVFLLCRSCDTCQRKRAAALNRELLLTPVALAIFDKVYVDLMGPLRTSESGNKYIMAMLDHFSKYVIAVPIPDCSSSTVAQVLMNDCILKYGVMTELVSDNASYLRAETMIKLGKLLRVHRYFCTPYHHEGNGTCERVFATFQLMLRSYVSADQSDWDHFVPACAFTYNTSVHGSTNNTPFFLMYGRDPLFNADLIIRHHAERHVPNDSSTSDYVEHLLAVLHAAWQSAYEFNEKQRTKYKTQYDQTHLAPLNIRAGDRVYLRNFAPTTTGLSSKLCMPWIGQFRVIEVRPPHLIIVSISCPSSPPKQVHMNQVKRCFTPSGPVSTSPWLPEVELSALDATAARNVDVAIPGYSRSTTISPDDTSMLRHHLHPYNTRYRKRLFSF